MGKKVDIKNAVADVGKAAAELSAKSKEGIVKALDQDGDGKLDAKDFALVRDLLTEKQRQIRREADRKKLRPIFEEDLDKADFQMSKLIRVAEMDKKHADSEICIGSVGFDAVYKDLRVVNIYPDKTDAFGLSFYPDADNGIYYVDPSDRDYYIALDDYFNYLRVARVSELQRIAQELGAKHFRVTYKEQKKSFTKTDARVKLEAKDTTKHGGKAEADHKAEQSSFEKSPPLRRKIPLPYCFIHVLCHSNSSFVAVCANTCRECNRLHYRKRQCGLCTGNKDTDEDGRDSAYHRPLSVAHEHCEQQDNLQGCERCEKGCLCKTPDTAF